MRKSMFIILIPIILILLAFLSIVAFYSIPFVKANSLLISANKSDTIIEIEYDRFISQENYHKLRIINKDISDEEYVQLKTNKKYKFINLKNIDLICSVKATVDSFDEMVTPEVFKKDFKISFSFIDDKWIVSDVST